jgi:hypothetical protein
LKRYKSVADIPIDTTHLKIGYPYPLHKLLRVVRMVMNIGFKKKVPLIQKGKAPKQIVNPYFNKEHAEFRNYINNSILDCPIIDKKTLTESLEKINNVYGSHFFIVHGIQQDIYKLYRISQFIKV